MTWNGKRAAGAVLTGAALIAIGIVAINSASVSASAEPNMTVSAIDSPNAALNKLPESASNAADKMSMPVTSEATGALVARLGNDSIYLIKQDADNICIARTSTTHSAGTCGARSSLLSSEGLYLITGQPGDLSAIVVVPDEISSAVSSEGTAQARNNVAILNLTGEDSRVTLGGQSRSWVIDFGPLIPPSG